MRYQTNGSKIITVLCSLNFWQWDAHIVCEILWNLTSTVYIIHEFSYYCYSIFSYVLQKLSRYIIFTNCLIQQLVFLCCTLYKHIIAANNYSHQ